jgi:WD40 repeat protein
LLRELRLWDVANGKALGEPVSNPTYLVQNGVFSPDGRVWATGHEKTIRLWNTTTAEPICPPLVHPVAVAEIVFSADGRVAATRGQGREVWLWDVATGRSLGPPLLHSQGVSALALSPDGSLLITCMSAEVAPQLLPAAARWWDTRTGLPIGGPFALSKEFKLAGFTPDGKRLVLTTVRSDPASHEFHQIVELRRIPELARGSPQRLSLWAQAVTGMELNADGLVQPLTPTEWFRRRQQLRALDSASGP